MSMLQLNFQTVEYLVFRNEAAQSVLPAFFASYFESWRLSKRVPALRQLGKSAVLDFLNGLRDDHVAALERFFGERIVLEKLNYSAVTNVKIPLEETEACKCLCDAVGFRNFSIWRDDRYLYVTFWR